MEQYPWLPAEPGPGRDSTPAALPLLLGIDGGGSKTLALITDLAGRALGWGLAGPSNYHAVGVAAAHGALDAAVAAALAEVTPRLPLALPASPFAALALGLAGIARPEDRPVIQAWAETRYPGVPTTLVHDAHLVLAAGTPDLWGLALICGTGSMAYGADPAGRSARAGGWGYLLGDEGSGYALGLAALRAVMRAADGRGPATALTPAILARWELLHPQELVRYVYRPEIGRTEIAALAALVDAAAVQGDPVAQALTAEAGRELALAVQAVARQLAFTGATPCALAGSVLVKGQAVATAFHAAAVELGLQLEPLAPVAEPVWGAIRLARAALARAEKERRPRRRTNGHGD